MSKVTKIQTPAPAQLDFSKINAIDEQLANADAIAQALMSQDEHAYITGRDLMRLALMIHKKIDAARAALGKPSD